MTTNKKAARASNTNGPHTDTNSANFPMSEAQSKEFATLAAGFAIKGHALHRSDPNDGTVTFWAERWGLVRYLPTIDAARRFLEQIGGRM